MPERGMTVAGFSGWRAEDLAAATGATVEQALRLLEEATGRGEVARLTCGRTVLYARLAGDRIALVPAPTPTPINPARPAEKEKTMNNEMTTPNAAHAGLDAWSIRAFAEAANMDEMTAERLLDESVAEGLAVRVSQGGESWVVPGDLRARLTDIGVVPVEGERLAERQHDLRQRFARERARRLTEGDAR